MRSMLLILLSLLAAFAAPAFAGEGAWAHGYYGGVGLHAQFLEKTDLSSNDAATNAILRASNAKMDFETGGAGALFFGHHWDTGWRVEAEGSYGANDLGDVKSSVGDLAVGGKVEMAAVMLNGLYEFEEAGNPLFTYLGAGFGYGWAKGTLEVDGKSDSSTAGIPLAQPILGIGYHLTRQTSLAVDYRYMIGLDDLDFDTVKGDYRAHKIGLVLRYEF